MSIRIECPHCGAEHRVVRRLLGRTLRCPKCDQTIPVPTAETLQAARQARQVERQARQAERQARQAERARRAEQQARRAAPISPGMAAVVTPASMPSPAGRAIDDAPEPVPFGNRKKREEDELDMTAMVDVTFLLLIFFMVTASFSLRKSIPLPPQQSDAPSTAAVQIDPDQLDVVTVQIDPFNSFLVLAPDWERETPGKQNLVSALREAFTLQSGGMRLAIECHEQANLQALVDAMDAGTIVGFTELQITTVEDFD